MNKMVSGFSVVSAAFALSLSCGAPAAFATSSAKDDGDIVKVCDVPVGTTKVENPTDAQRVVVAPEGYEIDKICVKAGSGVQGDGVAWISGNGATTITVTHPSGKDVSHFVVYYRPITVVLPPEEEEPTDGEHPQVNWIVSWPEFPTVCKGVPSFPASTEQVSYASYGEFVAIYPQVGWIFVQDFVKPNMTYIELPITSLEEVCPEVPIDEQPPVEENPIEEEKPEVVTPPDVQIPPVVDVTPVIDVPAAPAVVAVPVAPTLSGDEPVSAAPAVDAALATHVDAPAVATIPSGNLANTGWTAIAALFAALFLMSGTAVLALKKRLSGIKK